MNSFIPKKIRWPAGYLIFFIPLISVGILLCAGLFSCNGKPPIIHLVPTARDSAEKLQFINRAFCSIAAIKKNIYSGYLVTRTGNDFTSRQLSTLNRRNKIYSHCGIASIENDSLFIYHAVGGEWNPGEKLKRESWEQFAEPFSNKGVGIFRFQIPKEIENKLIATVQNFYISKLPFDMDFDLSTDDKMYCAEFIYKSFLKASDYTLQFNHSYIRNFKFIGVDDLFLHPLCSMQAEIVYK